MLSNSDSVTVNAVQAPALTLDKSGAFDAYGIATGELVTYAFTVTNTGNVTLSGVSVSDPLVSGLAYCRRRRRRRPPAGR